MLVIIGPDQQCWWFHCASHLQGSAFAPVSSHLQLAAGFLETDMAKTRLEKLNRRFPTITNDDLVLLAVLLSIEDECIHDTLQLSPARRRERLFEVLIELVEITCADSPLLLIIEDLHWIDPSTMELLKRLAVRIVDLRLLLLVTSRPKNGNASLCSGMPHLYEMKIRQLAQDDCFTLLNSLNEDCEIPRKTAREIVDRTDGVPLFIEDVTLSLLHSLKEN